MKKNNKTKFTAIDSINEDLKIKKNKYIKVENKLQLLLKNYTFFEAEELFESNINIISINRYKSLKRQYIRNNIDEFFLQNNISNSIELSKTLIEKYFKYIGSNELLYNLLTEKIVINYKRLLAENKYISAEKYYSEFKHILPKQDIEEYYEPIKEIEKTYHLQKYLILLKIFNFHLADNSYEQEKSNIKKFTYEKLKGEYIQKYFEEKYIEKKGNNEVNFKLDEQQAEAVGAIGDNILISARAGSGKTRVLVSKILYLLEVEKLKWDSICVLAFNRNVPKEILERLHNEIVLKEDPNKYDKINIASTFHKLARDIVKPNGEILTDKKKFIKEIVEKLKEEDGHFRNEVYKFFRTESLKIDKKVFKDPSDYYSYIRNKKFSTLNNEYVKSLGEKWIADFLFEHGIEYQYEKSFYPSYIKTEEIEIPEDKKDELKNFLKDRNETKPDFYLKDSKIIWEHWGIDENERDETKKDKFGQIFKDTSWDKYKETMEWKRKFWSGWLSKRIKSSHWAQNDLKNVKKLIETSVVDSGMGRDKFEETIKNLLIENHIKIKRRSQKELTQKVWKNAIDKFTTMIESFINRYQQKYFDNYEQFKELLNNFQKESRTYMFLKLGTKVFDLYERKLLEEHKLDFNQLIYQASQKIDSGEADDYVSKYKWILIDEYQDFSKLFLNLIMSIRNRNNCVKLFCVGDNWQAINRFAGSDTTYFDNFEEYFDNCNHKSIQYNYRSVPEIIECSNNFMKSNGFSGKDAESKKTNSSKSIFINDIEECFVDLTEGYNHDKGDKIFRDQFIDKQGNKESNYRTKCKYLKECYNIIIENKNAKSILILHRNNNFKFQKINYFADKLVNVLLKSGIFTAKDKLKEKIQIMTMHKSKGVEADIVIILDVIQGLIPMNHPDNELYEIFGEDHKTNIDDQKRLFYVAITRAKEKLYLLYEKGIKSDFLKDLIN